MRGRSSTRLVTERPRSNSPASLGPQRCPRTARRKVTASRLRIRTRGLSRWPPAEVLELPALASAYLNGWVVSSSPIGLGGLGCSVGARAYLGPRPPGRAVGGVMGDWSSLGSTPAARSLSGSPLWVGATEAEGAGWSLRPSLMGGGWSGSPGVSRRSVRARRVRAGEGGGSCVWRSCGRSSATRGCGSACGL